MQYSLFCQRIQYSFSSGSGANSKFPDACARCTEYIFAKIMKFMLCELHSKCLPIGTGRSPKRLNFLFKKYFNDEFQLYLLFKVDNKKQKQFPICTLLMRLYTSTNNNKSFFLLFFCCYLYSVHKIYNNKRIGEEGVRKFSLS